MKRSIINSHLIDALPIPAYTMYNNEQNEWEIYIPDMKESVTLIYQGKHFLLLYEGKLIEFPAAYINARDYFIHSEKFMNEVLKLNFFDLSLREKVLAKAGIRLENGGLVYYEESFFEIMTKYAHYFPEEKFRTLLSY